jgi:hypothetical protein
MSSPHVPIRPRPLPIAMRTALLIPFLLGVFFAEGWLAGATPVQAGIALPRAIAMRDSNVRKTSNVESSKAPDSAVPKAVTATIVALTVMKLSAVAKVPAAPVASPALDAINPPRSTVKTTERRRDPFRPLVRSKDEPSLPFLGPPGKAGLTVNTLQVQGTVRTQEGMTAIVANPQGRVYFLHAGDKVYDGVVQEIRAGSVAFQQHTQDAFGHPVERTVIRQLAAASGGTP